MTIERRSILKCLVGLVAAPTIIKVSSLMPVNAALQPGTATLTIDQITRAAVQLFKNNNAFLRVVQAQYEDEFGKDGAKIGDTLRIRLPAYYVVSNGLNLWVQQPADELTYAMARRELSRAEVDQRWPVSESQIPAPLALAAAAVAVAPQALKTPVTRRFWKLPQHSAASQED